MARLPAKPHKDENMADIQPPQRLHPQDILKLLMALRRALKAKPA
ncbi:Transcriptional regulator [Pseudomonas sp. IT-P74]